MRYGGVGDDGPDTAPLLRAAATPGARSSPCLQHHSDNQLGVAVIDRFTYATLEYTERLTVDSTATLKTLVRTRPAASTLRSAHANASCAALAHTLYRTVLQVHAARADVHGGAPLPVAAATL